MTQPETPHPPPSARDVANLAAAVKQATTQRAEGVESDRVERAEGLAQDVEATRVETAAVTAATAADVEFTRAELAAILEADRKRHNVRMEERVEARAKQTSRKFLVLFLFGALVFGLLAYRTEVNSADLQEQQTATRQAFYDACLARQERQQQANVGRETMVQLAVNGPNAPVDPTEKVLMEQRLRDALLLPVEDCGTAP